MTLACAVGGCNVEAADALSGLRTWEETQRAGECGMVSEAFVSGFDRLGVFRNRRRLVQSTRPDHPDD